LIFYLFWKFWLLFPITLPAVDLTKVLCEYIVIILLCKSFIAYIYAKFGSYFLFYVTITIKYIFINFIFFQVFYGNNDAKDVTLQTLKNPIMSRFVRFQPTMWTGDVPCLRVEVFNTSLTKGMYLLTQFESPAKNEIYNNNL